MPLIVISKYAKRAYVSHVRHEYGSLLRFIEYNWGLPSLGTTDGRSDPLLDFFSFAGTPPPARPVASVHAGIDAAFFATKVQLDTQPLDYTPEEK